MDAAGSRIQRRGARVLLVAPAGADGEGPRLLMVRGHDPHAPDRSFWFTPGGGIEPGEQAHEAAVRELAEETGYVLEPGELRGPVWLRTALFDFASRPYTQHEEIFVGYLVDAERRDRTPQEWTAVEQETLDEWDWMTERELREAPLEVFPQELRRDWRAFLEWDGVSRDLGEVDE